MSEPAPPLAGRLVPRESARLEPAFPVARLLSREQQETLAMREEAQSVLADARAQARQLIADAHADADAIRRSVEAQAFGQLEARVEAFAARIDRAAAAFEREFESEVLEAATALASKVLSREIDTRSDALADLAAAVAADARRYRQLKIRLHPDDAATLEPHWAALQARLKFATRLTLVADPQAVRGQVVVEHEGGSHADSAQTRLAKLVDRLLRGRRGEPS